MVTHNGRRNTARTGQAGINRVEDIVINELIWRWQSLDQHNDDALDGLIFVEDKNSETTGQVIFAQVKCWDVPRSANGFVTLPINTEKLRFRARRWRRVAGASIVIWVDPRNMEAFWADLQDPDTFTKSGLKVSLQSKFGDKSATRLRRLAGTQGEDNLLQIMYATPNDTAHVQLNASLKETSKKLLFEDIEAAIAKNKNLGVVKFSRVGWKHITRTERPTSRVVQSLHLIKIAQRMIEEIDDIQLIRTIGGSEQPAEIYAITARVVFRHRDAAVVRVIILKQLPGPKNPDPKTWFYSVYERRRRRGLRGEHT